MLNFGDNVAQGGEVQREVELANRSDALVVCDFTCRLLVQLLVV